MSVSRAYNPVKIRVQQDDLTLRAPDGRDEVYATPELAQAAVGFAYSDTGDPFYLNGELLPRRDTKFVIVPAWVA